MSEPMIPSRVLWLAGLFAAEMLLLVLGYQLFADLECRATGAELACRALRSAGIRVICLALAGAVYLWLRPKARAALWAQASAASGRVWPLLHAGGMGLVLLPLALGAVQSASFGAWLPWVASGAVLAAVGGLFWAVAPAGLGAWARAQGWGGAAFGTVGLLLPDMADMAAPVWQAEWLTGLTFGAVAGLLGLAFDSVHVDPARALIGLERFRVIVASQCSGIEGFALVTAFLGLYTLLFYKTLRLVRFWLIVWPLALLASWGLNVLRIAGLIYIGARVSPELAVNGFHSFAGWFFFALLCICVLIFVEHLPWVHKDAAASQQGGARLREEAATARILPFVAMMMGGVLINALFEVPARGYVLQMALVLAAVLWLRRPIFGLLARPSALALAVGLAVGGLWILTAPEAAAGGGAVLSASVLWVIVRVLGTVLLVPLAEELFFRGYVQERLAQHGRWGPALGLITGAVLFALLHGRWLAAGLAGLAFGLLYARAGANENERLTNAVTAHAVANAVIAAVAVWRGDFSLI